MAQDGHAQGAATILLGDGRRARHRTDERLFPLPAARASEDPLGHWTFWGEQRGGDNLGIVYWLYNITGDEFLLELGDLIHRQTFDWTGILAGGR